MLEYFGQVATRFLLHEHGRDKSHDREAGHALQQAEHGAPRIVAIVDIGESQFEFTGNRVIHILGHGFQRRCEWQTRLQRTLHRVDGVGQLFFELVYTLLAVADQLQKRQGETHASAERGPDH